MPTMLARIVAFLLTGCVMRCHGFVQHTLEYEKDQNFQDKLCSTANIQFQTTTRSILQCFVLCSKTSGCRSVIYRKSSVTCYGLTNSLACTSFTTLSGASYYNRKCGTLVPLVTGPSGLQDSQITASSTWDNDFLAHFGRLDNPKAWGTATENLDEWIQFNFGQLREFRSITTQGYHTPLEYVTNYRVLASTDCASYSLIQSFTGNSDTDGHVNHVFSPPFVAKCIRVNPRTWVVWPTMRIEFYGCSMLPTQ